MLYNHAIIGGVVSDSLLLSTSAEAVRPFEVSSHLSCSKDLDWPCSESSTTLYMLRMVTISTANFSKNAILHTAPPLVTQGYYAAVWCLTNRCIRVPPLQLYGNGKFDPVITPLSLYAPNFKAYLIKVGIAPSCLGLSWSCERTVLLPPLPEQSVEQ